MSIVNGTGTAAAGPGAVTAGQLVASIRPALGDGSAVVWTDAELLGYLNEAVREYSQHVRRQSEATMTAVPGQRRYALPGDLLAVISVEHPVGQRPGSYLHPLGRRNRRFENGRLYDLIPRRDATVPPVLLLSFDPEPGTTLLVAYSRPHDAALSADSAVTVPAEHHHVLLHYVLYAAARRLQQHEQADPTSSSSLLMAQLASNTRRLELTYLNALNRILTQRRGEGVVVVW